MFFTSFIGSTVQFLLAASLTIHTAGSSSQVVATTSGGASERTTNTETRVFVGNTSGLLVKRGPGCAVFAKTISWSDPSQVTTVIVEEGSLLLKSTQRWRLGPDTCMSATTEGNRFYHAGDEIKPKPDAAGLLVPANDLQGCPTCFNLDSDVRLDLSALDAVNRAALSLVKWREVSGTWYDITDYCTWTTNGSVVSAELGGDGTRLDPRPKLRDMNPVQKTLTTTSIPGLRYCVLEYTDLTVSPDVTNAEIEATGTSLTLPLPTFPADRLIRFYRVRASE